MVPLPERAAMILDTAKLVAALLALAVTLTAVAWTAGLAVAHAVTP